MSCEIGIDFWHLGGYTSEEMKTPELAPVVDTDSLKVLCGLLLADAGRRYKKRVLYVADDVLEICRAFLTAGGAVRQLCEVFDRGVHACDTDWLTRLHLPPDFLELVGEHGGLPKPIIPIGTSWEDVEAELIRKTLVHYDYSRVKAAKTLGMTTKTLWEKMCQYRDRYPYEFRRVRGKHWTQMYKEREAKKREQTGKK